MKDTPQSSRAMGFWVIAFSPTVVKRAACVAFIVGIVLTIINHGDRFLSGNIDGITLLKILLTFCVPYSVSTYSSVTVIRQYQSN